LQHYDEAIADYSLAFKLNNNLSFALEQIEKVKQKMENA